MDINIKIEFSEKTINVISAFSAALALTGGEIASAAAIAEKKNKILGGAQERALKSPEKSTDENKERAVSDKPRENKYTRQDISAILVKLKNERGKDEVKSVLAKFNASKVSELQEECYSDFMDKVKERLENA